MRGGGRRARPRAVHRAARRVRSPVRAASAQRWISTLGDPRRDRRERRDRALQPRAFRRRRRSVLYGTDLGNGELPVGVNVRELEALAAAGVRGAALIAALADPWPFAERTHAVATFVPGEPPATLDTVPGLARRRDGPSRRGAASTMSTTDPGTRRPPAPRRPRWPRHPPSTRPIRSRRCATSSSGSETSLVYFDGNSLGRPPRRTAARLEALRPRGVGRPPDPRVGRVVDVAAVRDRRRDRARGDRRGARPDRHRRLHDGAAVQARCARPSTRSAPTTPPASRSSSTATTSRPTASWSRASPPSAAARVRWIEVDRSAGRDGRRAARGRRPGRRRSCC